MPNNFYFSRVDSLTHIVQETVEIPAGLDVESIIPPPEGTTWITGFPAVPGDALFNRVLYPRPEFARYFDERELAWVVDDAAALSKAKASRIAVLDARTTELIKRGFEYSGKRFSMSDAAQRNWIALSSGLANGMLQFPLPISTIDESSHILASANELKALLGAYLLYQADPTQPLGSGRTLKESVTSASTIEEVDAIVDERE